MNYTQKIKTESCASSARMGATTGGTGFQRCLRCTCMTRFRKTFVFSPNVFSGKHNLLLETCRSRVICKQVASRSGKIGAQSEN